MHRLNIKQVGGVTDAGCAQGMAGASILQTGREGGAVKCLRVKDMEHEQLKQSKRIEMDKAVILVAA